MRIQALMSTHLHSLVAPWLICLKENRCPRSCQLVSHLYTELLKDLVQYTRRFLRRSARAEYVDRVFFFQIHHRFRETKFLWSSDRGSALAVYGSGHSAVAEKSKVWTQFSMKRLIISWTLQYSIHLFIICYRSILFSTEQRKFKIEAYIRSYENPENIRVIQVKFGVKVGRDRHTIWNLVKKLSKIGWVLNDYFKSSGPLTTLT